MVVQPYTHTYTHISHESRTPDHFAYHMHTPYTLPANTTSGANCTYTHEPLIHIRTYTLYQLKHIHTTLTGNPGRPRERAAYDARAR
ncbi:hypothetical protein EON63_04085 [archaeon]|nr:MAG: hypothetical protein EON63_04085 [archaeon]